MTTLIVYLLYVILFALMLLGTLICVVLFIVVPFYMLKHFLFNLSVWRKWCRQGKYVLFVYSNSPNWHDYIEERILPHIKDCSIILNWSERKKWSPGLATKVFKYYGGYSDFNPMAVVFQPFKKTRVFPFYQPFREHKHGNPEALEKMEREFFESIQKISGCRLSDQMTTSIQRGPAP